MSVVVPNYLWFFFLCSVVHFSTMSRIRNLFNRKGRAKNGSKTLKNTSKSSVKRVSNAQEQSTINKNEFIRNNLLLYAQLSLNIGETIQVDGRECIIKKIRYIDTKTHKPHNLDVITVRIQNETGIDKEYERFQLIPRPGYIRQRKKLTKNCMVEIYSSRSKQWDLHPIENKNGKVITVNNKKRNIWSHKVRCCADSLNLTETSLIMVFVPHINGWRIGKIMKMKKSATDSCALDVFKLNYVNDNKIYEKNVHRFTCSIIPIDEDCAVLDNNDQKETILPDPTDLQCCRLLVEGYYRQEASLYKYFKDLSSLVCKYIGCETYELIMAIDEKTYQLAIQNRPNKLVRKYVCSNELSLLPFHQWEKTLKDKLNDKNEYSDEKYIETIKLLRLTLKKKQWME
eukprot:55641_1